MAGLLIISPVYYRQVYPLSPPPPLWTPGPPVDRMTSGFIFILEITGPLVYPRKSTRCAANIVLMLGQRRRRWPNIEPTLVQRPVVDVKHEAFTMLFKWCHNVKTTLGWFPEFSNQTQTSNQCWVDIEPASQTIAQHKPNIGLSHRVWCKCCFDVGPSSDMLSQH